MNEKKGKLCKKNFMVVLCARIITGWLVSEWGVGYTVWFEQSSALFSRPKKKLNSSLYQTMVLLLFFIGSFKRKIDFFFYMLSCLVWFSSVFKWIRFWFRIGEPNHQNSYQNSFHLIYKAIDRLAGNTSIWINWTDRFHKREIFTIYTNFCFWTCFYDQRFI